MRKQKRQSKKILSTTALSQTQGKAWERLDEVVDLIAETLCSRKQYIVYCR
jgi:hypothetical protein